VNTITATPAGFKTDISRVSVVMHVSDHFVDGQLQVTE